MDSASQSAVETTNNVDDKSFQISSRKSVANPNDSNVATQRSVQVNPTSSKSDENQISSQKIKALSDCENYKNATTSAKNFVFRSTHHQQYHHVEEENPQQMDSCETEIKSRNDNQDLIVAAEAAKVDTTQTIEQNNNSNSNSHKLSCPPEENTPPVSTTLRTGSEISKSSPTTTTTEINNIKEATDVPQIANERLQASIVSSASSENEFFMKTTHEPSSSTSRESEVKKSLLPSELIKECIASDGTHELKPTQVNDCSESNGCSTSYLESNSSLDSEKYENPFAKAVAANECNTDDTKVINKSNTTMQSRSNTDSSRAVSNKLCNYPIEEALIDKKFESIALKSNKQQEQNNCTSSSSSSRDIVVNETESRAPKIDIVDSSIASSILMQSVVAKTTSTTQPTKSTRIVGLSKARNFDRDETMSSSTVHRRSSSSEYIPTVPSDLRKSNTREVAKSMDFKRTEVDLVSFSNYCPLKPNVVEAGRSSFIEPQSERQSTSEITENQHEIKTINYQTSNQAIVASTIRHLFQQSAREDSKTEKIPRNTSANPLEIGVSSNRVMSSHASTSNITPNPTQQQCRESSYIYYGTEKESQKPQQPTPDQINKHYPELINSTNANTTSPYQHSRDTTDCWNNRQQEPSNSKSYHDSISGLPTTSNLEHIPRIPAMVDTVLAMQKTKPELERQFNRIQHVNSNQADYMQQQQQQHNYYGQAQSAASMKRSSMYVNNPDFSKQHSILQQDSQNPISYQQQNNDLSQLHMKPPDFSKVKESKAKPEAQKYVIPSITQQNFAEMSKKYNYVKDLRLKNPAPQEESSQDRTRYNNLYMKAPDFSMQKFQAKQAEQSTNTVKIANSCTNKSEAENPYVRKYPQLSDDVVMSVVPTKPSNSNAPQERKRNEYYDYQNYENRQQIPISYPSTVQLQHREYPSSSHKQTIQPDSKLTEQQQVSLIYAQKTQQLPASYATQSYSSSSYPASQQSQPNSAVTSVIQSSRSKEHSVEYRQSKPQERPMPNPNYYQHQQQQQQSLPHQSSPLYKTSSPSPVMSTRQYPTQSSIIQQIPSPAMSIPPNSNKSTVSPGMMNPPYGWPSQSSNSRPGQSPVASPHTPYRITQSPVGVNAPSPNSPSFLQPSPKPSPSPTNIPRPTSQTSNVMVNYKNPYTYHVQPEPPRDNRNSGTSYIPKSEKPLTDRSYSEQSMPIYRNDQPQQFDYMMNSFPTKPSKSLECADSAGPSRRSDSLKNSYRYAHSTESLNINKSPNNGSKIVEKPNYREMINHAYALRNATSEDDLNYEIIKRTLNKDISVRRSENDLSKNIFDSPVPTKNTAVHHYARSNDMFNNSRLADPYKYANNQDYSAPKMFIPSNISNTNNSVVKSPSSLPILPLCNDLNRNDISVTVSKIIKSPNERPRPLEKDILPVSRTGYVDNKDMPNVVISKMQADSLPGRKTSFSSRTRPPEPPPPAQKPITSVLCGGPVKRESPLDLSVKTVKTKADSTGCDDSNTYQARNIVTSNTLKVDFAPNFSKHVRTTSQQTLQAPQQQINCEAQHHHLLPSTSRQYPQKLQQSTNQANVDYMPQRKVISATSHLLHQHRSPQQAIAPYQTAYNQQRDQKMYQTTSQNPSAPSQDQSHLTYRSNLSVSTSVHAPPKPKHIDERPKIELDQTRKVEVPPKQSQYHDYIRQQPHQHARIPAEIPQSMQIPYNDQHYMDPSKYKQTYSANNNAVLARARSEEEYVKRMEMMKTQLASAHPNRSSTIPGQYNNHALQSIVHKQIQDPKALVPNDRRNNQSVDQYNRKRSLDSSSLNAPDSHYHPHEKRVRVDELYRAHLAQNHYVQQHQQNYHVQTSTPNHYEKREISAPRKDAQNTHLHYPGQPNLVHPQSASEHAPSGQTYHSNEPPLPIQASHPGQLPHVSQSVHSGQPIQSRFSSGPLQRPGQSSIPIQAHNTTPGQPPSHHTPLSHSGHLQYSSHSTHSSQSSTPGHHPTVEQYMQSKEGYKHPKYTHPNNVVIYQSGTVQGREQFPVSQQNQTWYPPIQKEEKREKEVSGYPQVHYNTSSYSIESTPLKIIPERVNSIRNVIHSNEPLPKSTMHPTQNHTNNTHRGADQNVIDKLRISIEMREYEKQKLLNRKQVNGELPEDEVSKPDIASLLAARIRTKGELKGYTPVPPAEQKCPPEVEIIEKLIQAEPNPQIDAIVNADVEAEVGPSALDLMDWGNTCNDFVEQLQTGTKKRCKKRKFQKFQNETPGENLNKVEVEADGNLPGVVYTSDIDQCLIKKIKSEVIEVVDQAPKVEDKGQVKDSSSDEDKPLLLLRQRSQTDFGKATIDKESDNKMLLTETKFQESEGSSAIQSQCSSITETNSDKFARTVKEKQRMEQEKRIAARLSKTSSSESEEEMKRSMQRTKKLTRKTRSRTSGASTREATDTDSSEIENKIVSRKLFRDRLESRKRKLAEKPSSSSEARSINKLTSCAIIKLEETMKTPIVLITPSSVLLKREIITKAQIKCMKLSSEKSESSGDNIEEIKKEKDEINSKGSNQNDSKDGSEAEASLSHDQQDSATPKSRPCNRKWQLPQFSKAEETMTRSKRKKELEQRIANSKVLRNDKIIQNTPIRKGKIIEKIIEKPVTRATRPIDSKSSEEKWKSRISTRSTKVEKPEDAKMKFCNESNEKIKTKNSKITQEASCSSSSDTSGESEPKSVSERLLLRRSRHSNESIPMDKPGQRKTRSSDRAKVEIEKKFSTPLKTIAPLKKSITPIKQKPAELETNTEKFPPGWELEVYQYKRSLKIPQSLISIKGPAHHRVSTSLPDLDPHSSDASESFSTDNIKPNIKQFPDTDSKNIQPPPQKDKILETVADKSSHETFQPQTGPRSIIDILHQRVPHSRRQFKKNARHIIRNGPRLIPRGPNETELLSAPNMKSNFYRGEHHHIREIFGGEDRPASAPPELIDSKEEIESNMTFDKKYEQYLSAMNDVDFGSKIRKNRKAPENLNDDIKRNILQFPIKKEKLDDFSINHEDEETQDTEINACLQNALPIKDETHDPNEHDTQSIISERDGVVTPLLFTRKKNNKIRSTRRKGSSGFDYIRKKKKPTTNSNNGQEILKKKRISPVELLHSRGESDVSKEVQRWVLNKGVGQSALHKAARLGYLDVIAFCLERMGLNPDSKDNAGYTPLHEACSKGRIDIARLLLQYGANHSETAASGIRPLHEASENGSVEIVRLLLSYGADPLLTTYSGQTPLMLADNNEMEQFIKNHLHDVQNTGPHKQPWKFTGAWSIYDPDTCGFDVLVGAPDIGDFDDEMDDLQVTRNTTNPDIMNSSSQEVKDKCDTNSNSILAYEDKGRYTIRQDNITSTNGTCFKTKLKTVSNCTVVLNSIDSIECINSVKQFKDYQSKNVHRRRPTVERREVRNDNEEETDVNCELFEFEEADVPLPPLYLLKDEGTEKWVLLSDLCSLLKVKSRDTLLKQISPTLPPPTNKELLRELKMSDFLEKATCLQLLCAGEKLNIRSSKVVLVKYNESVRNLLGVKTILMKF